jgi:PAS domain S-box-containing protein
MAANIDNMSEPRQFGPEQELEQLRAKVAQLESAVEQLRSSEAQLRVADNRRLSFLEHTPLAVITFDHSFRVLEWNASAERIFGYSTAEAVGQDGCELLVPAEGRAHVRRVFDELLHQVGGGRSTNDNITRDGKRIRCEWYNTPLFDSDGNVTGVSSMAHDVTDEEAFELAIRQSEGLLRSIIENAPEIVMRIDFEGRVSFINRVAENYTREQVLGSTIFDWVVPEHASILRESIDHVFRTRESVNYQVQEVVNGHWYECRLAPLIDGDNEVSHLVIICLDIHERKLQEENLRQSREALVQSEAMFRILAQNVPGVVYLCRNDERYSMLFLNDAIEALVGIPATEFLNDRASFTELFHPDDAMVIPPTVNAALARRSPYHLTYRLRRPDGSYIWAEEYGQGVFDSAGKLQFLEGTIFDVTAKRAAVEALHRSKEELEDQVQARTQQLRMANRLLRGDYQRQLDLLRDLKTSEERFRIMCDANPAPVIIARLSDSEIIYANDRVVELVGMPKESILGRKTIDFYQDLSDRQHVRETLLRERQLRSYEIQVRRADGKLLWLSFFMQVLDLPEGPCVLAIMIDVTARREYEQRLDSERRLLKRLLVMHERDRQLVAYEIHDGFVQDVTGAILHLQASSRKINPDDIAQKDLNKGIDILRGAIDEARRLIDGLQPGVLEEQGVVEGVRYLAQQTERMHGIPVELQIEVQFDRLAPAVEQAIYRIVQEGLSNIVKHSKSPRARVVLSQRRDALVIKVEDWGVGFDTLTTKSRRYGLTGIRDRARLLNGKAKIRSEPGMGTRLRVKLPINDILIPDYWQIPKLGDDDSSSGIGPITDDSDDAT